MSNSPGGGNFELPMFPLGSVVFPGQVVPLHIFEDRYRQLLSDIITLDEAGELEAAETFGIALIERGHEVGGGDLRSTVGTRMVILGAERFDDGRWGVVTAGQERLEVHEWLDDDPYPRAIVSVRTVIDDGGASLDDIEDLLTECLTVAAAQQGSEAPAEIGWSSDPKEKLDQMSALSPLSDFDRQIILSAERTSEQISRLGSALEDKLYVLRGL